MARFIYAIGGVAVMTKKPATQTIAGSVENAEYAFLEIPDDTPIQILKQGDLFPKKTKKWATE